MAGDQSMSAAVFLGQPEADPADGGPGDLLTRAMQLEGVSPDSLQAKMAKSIWGQESDHSEGDIADNSSGAGGPMQMIQSTFDRVADPGWNRRNPLDNMRGGLREINRLLNNTQDDPWLAAVGYYGGDGAVAAAKNGKARLDPKHPSYPSTFQYADQVVERIPTGQNGSLSAGDFLKSTKQADDKQFEGEDPAAFLKSTAGRPDPLTEPPVAAKPAPTADYQEDWDPSSGPVGSWDRVRPGQPLRDELQKLTQEVKTNPLEALKGAGKGFEQLGQTVKVEAAEGGDLVWQGVAGMYGVGAMIAGGAFRGTQALVQGQTGRQALAEASKGVSEVGQSAVLQPFANVSGTLGQGALNQMIGQGLDRLIHYGSKLADGPEAQKQLAQDLGVGVTLSTAFLPAALHIGAKMGGEATVSTEVRANADRLKGHLDSAVDAGAVDGKAADLAKWVIDKNPHLVQGLNFEVGGEEGAKAATYNASNSTAQLINVASDNHVGVVHEIFHHVEKMLPPSVRDGILKAYDAAMQGLSGRDAQLVKDWKALGDSGAKSMDDFTPQEKAAKGRLQMAADQGVDVRGLYKFTNPSDFWAESASHLMDKRWQGGWQQQARDWVGGLANELKGVGKDQVVSGLRQVANGDGRMLTNKLLIDHLEDWGMAGMGAPAQAVNSLVGLRGLSNYMGEQQGRAFHDELVGRLMSGEDPMSVWRDKLAGEGADGKLRLYLEDSPSRVTPAFQSRIEEFQQSGQMRRGVYDLGDLYDHEMLYNIYPGLKNMDVTLHEGTDTYFKPKGGAERGGRMAVPGRLMLGMKNVMAYGDPRSVVAHEVQHAIDGLEGMARGGSVDEFTEKGWSVPQAIKMYESLTGEVYGRMAQWTLGESLDDVRQMGLRGMEAFQGYGRGRQLTLMPGEDSPFPPSKSSRVVATMLGDLNDQPNMSALEEELMRASGASDEQVAAVKAGRGMDTAAVQGKYRGYGHAGSVLDILRQKREEAEKAAGQTPSPKPRYKLVKGEDGNYKAEQLPELESKTGTDDRTFDGEGKPFQNASQVLQNDPDRVKNLREGGNPGKTVTDPRDPTFESKQKTQSRNAPRKPTPNLDEHLGEPPTFDGVQIDPQFLPKEEVPNSIFADIGDVLNKISAERRTVANDVADLHKHIPAAVDREAVTRVWSGEKARMLPSAIQAMDNIKSAFRELTRRAREAGVSKPFHEDFLNKALDGGLGTMSPEVKARLPEMNFRQLLEAIKQSGARLETQDIGEIYKQYAEAYNRATYRKGLVQYLKHPDVGLAWRIGQRGRAPAGWEPLPSASWTGYLVHPDLVPALKFVFDHTEPQLLLKGAFWIGQAAKRVGTIGSFFHATSLIQSAWAGAGPLWASVNVPLGIADRVLGTRMSAITRALDLYRSNKLGGQLDQLIKGGLKFDHNDDGSGGLLQAMGEGADSFLQRLTGKDTRVLGKAAGAVEHYTLGFFDRFTWDYLHTGLKASVAMKLQEDMLRGNPDMQPAVAAREVSKFVNSAFGGLNWYQVATDTTNRTVRNIQLGLFNRQGRMLMQTLMFAPDWTVSTWKNFESAIKPSQWKGMGGGMWNPKTSADLARRYQFRTALTYLTLINGVNIALSGHSLADNKDPTRIDLGDGQTMQPMKHAAEPYHWITEPATTMKNKLGFLPKFFLDTLGGDYRKSTASKALKSLEQLIPFQLQAGLQAPTNEQLTHFLSGEFGMPILGKKTTGPGNYSTP